MKKLNKIKLNDFQEMNDSEMKQVVGGSDDTKCGEAWYYAKYHSSGWEGYHWDDWHVKMMEACF